MTNHEIEFNNIKINQTRYSSYLAWCGFLATIMFYILVYAGKGIENNDTGFILGLAHQIYSKKTLYNEIIYIRPPITPILHSFVFFKPFSEAPIFFSRAFFFIEIAIYSCLSALIARREFGWDSSLACFIATMSFIFSAHVFPPMPWHTIDGILFSVIAFYLHSLNLKGRHVFIFFSILSSLLAAGTKQPFYLTPIIIIALTLYDNPKPKYLAYISIHILGGVCVLLPVLNIFVSMKDILKATSSQTSLGDLLSAGVIDYARDITQTNALITMPLFLAFIGLIIFDKYKSFALSLAPVISTGLILAGLGLFYYQASSWNQPLVIFDSTFIVTWTISFAMLIKTRDRAWLIVTALHLIAWASSISWGYKTVALYFSPSIITACFFCRSSVEYITPPRITITSIVLIALSIFYIGHSYYYSLEGDVKSADLNTDLSHVNTKLKYIYSTPAQAKLYLELSKIIDAIHDQPFVVLPNMPLAHLLANTPNPIGIDWPINAEVGAYEKEILNKLNDLTEYAFIFRDAKPTPHDVGKFGSNVTLHVLKNWKLLGKTTHFDIYQNPLRHGDAHLDLDRLELDTHSNTTEKPNILPIRK